MKDYFGNNINIGDTIIYVENAGASLLRIPIFLKEGIVEEMREDKDKREIVIDDSISKKERNNVINLTALGLRQRSEWNEDKWNWEKENAIGTEKGSNNATE